MAVVLITGCSSGIGKVSALAFARKGYQVFAGARNPDDCAALTVISENEGLKLEVVQLDVTDPQAVSDAVARAIDVSGRIDVLVNNAGIGRLAALEDMTDDEIDQVMHVNFIAPLRLSRAVLPVMRAQDYGRIIMVSSLSALVGLPGETIYCASKAALEAMAEGLRHEVGCFNIAVSVVEPGSFNTAMPGKIALGAACPPESPYAPLLQHLQQEAAAGIGHGDDPQRVAELLVRIAGEKHPAFRYPAGEQAETVTETLRGLDADARERFIRAVNDTNWWSAGEQNKGAGAG